MPAAGDRTRLIDALDSVWRSLTQLGDDLDESDWDTPTECPGWTVRDQFSHMIGTELMLLDRPDPAVDVSHLAHIKNDIAKFNEGSIELRRARPGADVLEEFRSVTAERLDALRAMSDADFDAESFTPAGQDTYGRFMQIRTFDCWIHEQDVRGALHRPGHAGGPTVEVAIDEHATALGFIVGKKAGAAEGQSVRLELTGETGRVLDVRVDGRAQVVDDLDQPTATISCPTLLWFRYLAGRRPADPKNTEVTVDGDVELGTRVVQSVNYTI